MLPSLKLAYADLQIVLLSEKLNEGDRFGLVRLVGEVKNIGNENASSIFISLNVLDKNGDWIGSKSGYPARDIFRTRPNICIRNTCIQRRFQRNGVSSELSLLWNNPDNGPGYVGRAQIYKDNLNH